MSSHPSFIKLLVFKGYQGHLVTFLIATLALGMMLPSVSKAFTSEVQVSELDNQTLSQTPNTSFDLHVREWEKLARAAESDKLSKFAIYQSRTLAVKRPEIYLQADAMFDRILTTTSGTKQYYLERTQNLLEQEVRYNKIQTNPGPPFSWKDFAISMHQEVSYAGVYKNPPCFLPFVDMRLHFLGTALKGTDWQATPLNMAEFLYFKLKSEGKDPYLILAADGSAYVDIQEKKGLFSSKKASSHVYSHKGEEVDKLPPVPILVFNERFVWYPLMERDDRRLSLRLSEIVSRLNSQDEHFVPELSPVEQRIVTLLKTNTDLRDKEESDWCIASAARVHVFGVGFYPDLLAKLLKDDFVKNTSHGSSFMIARNALLGRMSGRVSPPTAELAAIAIAKIDKGMKESVAAAIASYQDHVATRENPRAVNLGLWFHDELIYTNMDDSYYSKASYCITSASNCAAIFDVADLPGIEYYIVGLKYHEMSGGHAWLALFSNQGDKGVIENGRWAPEFHGFPGNDPRLRYRPVLDLLVTENTWIATAQDARVYTRSGPAANINVAKVEALFRKIMDLGPETRILVRHAWPEVKDMVIDEFIQKQIVGDAQRWRIFEF